MPNILCSLNESENLELFVTTPRNRADITIEIINSESWDVALKICMNFKESKILISSRHDKKWANNPEIDFKFEKYNKLVLILFNKTININGVDIDYSPLRSIVGREIKIKTNLDWVTIGSGKNSEQHFAMRWPFLLRYENRPWLTSRMSLMAETIAYKTGVSAVISFDGNENALTDLLSVIHQEFDEIIIAIHSPSSVNIEFIRRTQSIYFNVVYYISPYMRNDNIGDADRAFFLNGLLEMCSYRNVMFVDIYDDARKIRSIIWKNRIRTRQDHFTIVGFERNAQTPAVLAFSLRKSTYVIQGESGLTFPDDDVIARNVDFVGDVDIPGSLNWSVSIDDQISGDGAFKKKPLVSLRGYLNSYAPSVRPRMLVMIISCKANRHKQDAIRETWLKDLSIANIEHIFVEGDPAIEKVVQLDDRLFVPSQDSYEYLSHKIHKSITAIKNLFNPDFILKIDDDCACNVQKLLEVDLINVEYLGTNLISGRNSTYDWHKKSLFNKQLQGILFKAGKDINWFDGGGGYFIGRRAINIIAEMDLLNFSHMFEDYAVGQALDGKIKLSDITCGQFTSIRNEHIRNDEDYRNTLILDVNSSERMLEIYKKFEGENIRALSMRDGINVVVS